MERPPYFTALDHADRLQQGERPVVYVLPDEVAARIKGANVAPSLVLPVDVASHSASLVTLSDFIQARLPVVGSDVPEIHDVSPRFRSGMSMDGTFCA
jgi:hypothetical protein